MIDASFTIECDGKIEVDERKERKSEEELYDVSTLLEQLTNRLELNICVGDDEAPDELPQGYVCLRLRQYHVNNKETNRTFHTQLHAYLNKRQLAQTHAFIGFLLQNT